MDKNLLGAEKIASIVLWVIALVVVGLIAKDVYSSQTTGLLEVVSPNKNATLSITQANHQAIIIGTGSAHVLLKPGSYLVGASSGGYSVADVVTIQKKQTTISRPDPANYTLLPSVVSINFENFDELANSGVTSGQLDNIKQAFFNFKKSTRKVELVANTITPAPLNPNSSDFSMDFGVMVDSKIYKTTITYGLGSTVSFKLTDTASGEVAYTTTVGPSIGD
jgi:hypothetical protein